MTKKNKYTQNMISEKENIPHKWMGKPNKGNGIILRKWDIGKFLFERKIESEIHIGGAHVTVFVQKRVVIYIIFEHTFFFSLSPSTTICFLQKCITKATEQLSVTY